MRKWVEEEEVVVVDLGEEEREVDEFGDADVVAAKRARRKAVGSEVSGREVKAEMKAW